MLKWLVLCCVVLFVKGQEPNPTPGRGCCTPDQWEGYAGELIGVAPRFRKAKVFASGIEISYDYSNKKLAETIHVRHMNKSFSVGLIFDFAQQKMYRFLESKRKCQSRRLTASFKQFCLPGSARALGSFYYGAGNNKLQVTSYSISIPKRKAELFVELTTGCIPVGETVIGSAGLFKKYIAEVGFADITPGIKNPKVFTPPAYCKSDYKEYEVYEDTHDEEIDEDIVQHIHSRFME